MHDGEPTEAAFTERGTRATGGRSRRTAMPTDSTNKQRQMDDRDRRRYPSTAATDRGTTVADPVRTRPCVDREQVGSGPPNTTLGVEIVLHQSWCRTCNLRRPGWGADLRKAHRAQQTETGELPLFLFPCLVDDLRSLRSRETKGLPWERSRPQQRRKANPGGHGVFFWDQPAS